MTTNTAGPRGTIGVHIRPGQVSDLAGVTEITDQEFGAGLFLRRHRERVFDPASGIFCSVAVDPHAGVVGYTIDALATPEILREEFHIEPEVNGGTFGVLKMAAVRKSYQRRGIGTALSTGALARFDSLGVGAVYASAWLDPRVGMAPAAAMLARLGFHAIGSEPDFWRDSAREHPRHPCGACGTDCRCAAVIFRRGAGPAIRSHEGMSNAATASDMHGTTQPSARYVASLASPAVEVAAGEL